MQNLTAAQERLLNTQLMRDLLEFRFARSTGLSSLLGVLRQKRGWNMCLARVISATWSFSAPDIPVELRSFLNRVALTTSYQLPHQSLTT
jgi:uncharacterized protein (DUF2267 family)